MTIRIQDVDLVVIGERDFLEMRNQSEELERRLEDLHFAEVESKWYDE